MSTKNYWLLKSEPSTYAWEDLEKQKDQTDLWDGIRNYQARNFMKTMKVGDLGFFYHSSTKVPAIIGIVEIVKEFYPDPTQFDPNSQYFFPQSSQEKPVWFAVDVKLKEKLNSPIKLKTLREVALSNEVIDSLELLKKSRLSVQPVNQAQWKAVLELVI